MSKALAIWAHATTETEGLDRDLTIFNGGSELAHFRKKSSLVHAPCGPAGHVTKVPSGDFKTTSSGGAGGR